MLSLSVVVVVFIIDPPFVIIDIRINLFVSVGLAVPYEPLLFISSYYDPFIDSYDECSFAVAAIANISVIFDIITTIIIRSIIIGIFYF